MQPVLNACDVVQVIKKKTILQGLNLTVPAGEVLGIFGARSAGKTTLLHLLAGIDKFKSGSVEIMGLDICRTDAYKKHLGLVTQERSLFQELRVVENLDFIATLRGGSQESIAQLVTQLALQKLLREPVATLDQGPYQRVALACALLNEPQLLLADELMTNLDFASQQLIGQTIRHFLQNGGTLLCGLSDLAYAPQLTRVGWLSGGQLTFYRPAEAVAAWQRQVATLNQQSGVLDD